MDQEIEKGRAEEVEMKIKRDSKRVRQRYNGEQNQGGVGVGHTQIQSEKKTIVVPMYMTR